jgi:hypothetical protein
VFDIWKVLCIKFINNHEISFWTLKWIIHDLSTLEDKKTSSILSASYDGISIIFKVVAKGIKHILKRNDSG